MKKYNASTFTNYSRKRINRDSKEKKPEMSSTQYIQYKSKKDTTTPIVRNQNPIINQEFDSYHIKRKEFPNTKRVIDINYREKLPEPEKVAKESGAWDNLMGKTSGEESILSKNKRISNSKTFISNIFPETKFNKDEETRHIKKATYTDHLHKTQITTLPGGVKMDKYNIKDDMYFNNNNTTAHLYKMIRDFNSDLDYKRANPIKPGDCINIFPTYERYLGSYKRFEKNNDIFNLKEKENEKDNKCLKDTYDEMDRHPLKRMYFDNKTFKSQIDFV